ncbi:MAG: DUF5700 domain-containing putative Zn-dependent protease [Gemmatimonadales bacterium]
MSRLLATTWLLTLLAPPPAAAQAASGTIDVSGLERYWRIQAVLARGAEPAAAAWDSLFETPGYAALEKRERRRSALRQAIRLAALPALRDSAVSVMAKPGFLASSVAHLRAANDDRERLIDGTSEFVSVMKTEYQAGARRVATLLGDSLVRSVPPPPVALILFAPDGRGYPQLIIGDLRNLLGREGREGFFAHELFHFYRRRIGRPRVGEAGADRHWLDAIGNVEEEGIADQLDKAEIPGLSVEALRVRFPDSLSFDFYRQYRELVLDGARWIRFADSALATMPAGDSARLAAGRRFASALPISGRPLGAYMAGVIRERSGGWAPLRAVAGNPIAFWLAYDRAATGEPAAPRLSEPARAALERLRRHYGSVGDAPSGD